MPLSFRNKLVFWYKMLEWLATREKTEFAEEVDRIRCNSKSIPKKFIRRKENKHTKKVNVVLFLVHSYELGGAESFALETIKWAYELNLYVIAIATVPSKHKKLHLFEKVSNEIYAVDDQGFVEGTLFLSFILQKIKSQKVDVIHIHHSTTGYNTLPEIKARHPNIRVVDSLHIIEHHNGGFPFVSIEFQKYIDCTHVISQNLARVLVKRGVPERKIYLKYLADLASHGIDVSEESIRERYQKVFQKGRIDISFIGRLTLQKRPDIFIEFVKELNKEITKNTRMILQFHVFGDGEYRKYIEDMAEEIPNLKLWPDNVGSHDIIKNSDISILPSQNEGITLTSFEAAISGTLFFATDVGAQAEFIPKKFLVSYSPFTYIALKEKVMAFIMSPKKFLNELVKWNKKSKKLLKHSVNCKWLFKIYTGRI